MAHTIISRETLQKAAYKDTLEKQVIEFDERPTMAAISYAVRASYAMWDDDYPEGAAFLTHIYSIRMSRTYGKYRVEVETNTPFND